MNKPRDRVAANRRARHLPSVDELREFINQAEDGFDVRDAARHFGVKSKDRPALRGMIRKIIRPEGGNRGPQHSGEVPPVGVLDVERITDDGDLTARYPPSEQIFRVVGPAHGRAAVPGDRILARLDGDAATASIIRVLPGRTKNLVGIVRVDGKRRIIEPIDRGTKTVFEITGHQDIEAEPGDLVRATPMDRQHYGLPKATLIANLGSMDRPRAIGQAMAHKLDLPIEFPPEALDLAQGAKPVTLGKRTDLRGLQLLTIDGADARDFDDAVFAEPKGAGHRIVVAIADVAHYVRPGDPLDKAARARGNSVYFPDHAIPMLPEALSNDLCSLRPDEDRACLAVDMEIDPAGNLIKFVFKRALMRSVARLTYEQVQDALDGQADDRTMPLVDPHLKNLEAAYRCLLHARGQRGTLDLDLPERMVLFDDQGRPSDLGKRQRLDSHRLIEEMMILANVAAARALEKKGIPFLYRAHDRPDAIKLDALHDFLARLGIPLRKTAGRVQDFTHLIERVDDPAIREIVSMVVLRCQAQAVYQPGNIGHFGLNLRHYAHFTSPIRRYSDLMLHRALIRAFGLGEGGLHEATSIDETAELGEHLSTCERRAMEAERRTMERMVALIMEQKLGAEFAGRISSAQRFGVFVSLDSSGAEGLVPVSMLGDDRFFHDERHQALIGEHRRKVFAVGDRLTVKLTEVNAATGSLIFTIASHQPGPAAKAAAKAGLPKAERHNRHRGDRAGGSRRRSR